MHLLKDRGFNHPIASEITPRAVVEQRRALLRQLAAGTAGATLALWAARDARAQAARPGKLAALPGARSSVPGAMTMDKPTPYADASTYNNFYEFGTDKADPARNAHTLKTRPWTVVVEGAVAKPRTYGIDDLLKLAPMEERIYRLRCVEGWSMVIPWVGYSLSELIKRVEPTGNAKYVEFVTLADPKTMPFVGSRVLESLRARRHQCDAMVCLMSAAEVTKLTRMGKFDMTAPATGAMAFLKRLRGKPPGKDDGNKGTAGAQQMKTLRMLPKILRFIPGTAQDVRAYFLTLQYWLAGSDDNVVDMIRALIDRPKRIDVPLGTLGDLGTLFAPHTKDRILNQMYQAFPDSPAAKGQVDKETPADAPATPARQHHSRSRIRKLGRRAARLVPGTHW